MLMNKQVFLHQTEKEKLGLRGRFFPDGSIEYFHRWLGLGFNTDIYLSVFCLKENLLSHWRNGFLLQIGPSTLCSRWLA